MDEKMKMQLQNLARLGCQGREYLQRADFVALFPLRLYLVPVFWMAGMNKLGNLDGTAQWFASMGFPLPWLMALSAGLVEAGGAILLLVGLGTRLICIPLMFTMVVAALTVHLQNGWLAIASSSDPEVARRLAIANEVLREHTNYQWLTEKGRFVILNNGVQYAVTYLLVCLTLLVTGPGRYLSLDYWIEKEARHRLMDSADPSQ